MSTDTTHAEHDAAGTTPKASKSPSAIAYTVRKGKERSFWSRLGAQFEHQDGKGSTILLDVYPLDGEIVVRKRADPDAPAEAPAAEPAKAEAAPTAEKGRGRAPDQIAYSVRESNGRSYWTEIGIAYKHREEKGLSVSLHAIPMNNQVVLRDRSEPVAKEPATVEAA